MNTLSHEQAIRRLHEAVHYLSIEQQSDLAAHLAECDQCRAYADQLTTLQPRLTQALRARPYSSSRLPGPTIRSIQKHQRRLIMRKQLFGVATVLTVGLIVLVALSINRYPGSTSAGWQPSPTATPTATPTFIPTIVSALPTPTPANTFMSILPTPTPATDDSKHFKLPWTAGVSHCVTQNHLVQRNGAGWDFDLKHETVLAAQNGTVTFAGWHSEGGGNTIDIAHAGGVTSTYMHLSLIAVKPGAQVKQGQPIGVAGDTGQKTGPLLHFHIVDNGRPVEPIFGEVGHALKEGDCVTSQNVPRLSSDRLEPNDDFDQATPIDVNMKYDLLDFAPPTFYADGQDSDYFKIRVKPGMLITCRTLDLSPGTDTNLILYDNSQNGIEGQDDVDRAAGDLSSSVTYAVTYEGWLYVLVGEGFSRSPAEAQQATYSLECSTGP